MPDQADILAAVNKELEAAGKPLWKKEKPPAPNAVMPSDHVMLVIAAAIAL